MEVVNVAAQKKDKAPGVVIFAIILNFFSSAFWIVILAYGAFVGTQFFSQLPIGDYTRTALSVISAFSTFFYGLCALLSVFHALCAVFLIKKIEMAWYLQVTSLVAGMVFFWFIPPSLIISIVMLIFFFMPNTRQYFGV